MDNSVILVSPLHDPDARLEEEVIKNGVKLNAFFNNLVIVSTTENTSEKTIKALNNTRLNYSFLSEEIENTLGNNYRNAIKLGLEKNSSHILLLDFDRALHWTRRFAQELEEIKNKLLSLNGFTSFVRTRRAFESHPLMQRSTETTINAIASEVAKKDIDIMSGAFGMDRNFAETVLKFSKRDDFGFYAEILEIALKNNTTIDTIEVEGLEWETPDQYKDKINKEGYSQWLSEFESLSEWEKRVKLIEKSTEVLTENQ